MVYKANTDTYSVVRINLTEANIETSVLRVIPVSEHPRAICLRLEIHGCELDREHETGVPVKADIGGDWSDRDQEIVSSDEAVEDDALVNDDRKEIIPDTEQVTQLTGGHLLPVLLTALAAVSTLLIILSALLLRKLLSRGSRKQLPVPVSQPVNDVQYFQSGHHHYNQHNNHQLPIIKKNIYDVPKVHGVVEPIYSTPIEIFYPPSPSSLSTDSSECESLAKTMPGLRSATTSTPRQLTMDSSSSRTPRIQKFEELVTFSPIYSYFSPSGEPKYSNIV